MSSEAVVAIVIFVVGGMAWVAYNHHRGFGLIAVVVSLLSVALLDYLTGVRSGLDVAIGIVDRSNIPTAVKLTTKLALHERDRVHLIASMWVFGTVVLTLFLWSFRFWLRKDES